MAYNFFVNKIKRIAVEMDTFSNDFMNIIKRNALKK